MDIIRKLAEELAIKDSQVKATVDLIDEGNTIPFISRYRSISAGLRSARRPSSRASKSRAR